MVDVWYERMAAIPGIQFGGSPGVNRGRLAEARVRPRTEMGYLSWPTPDGSTSASPAHSRAFANMSRLERGELVRWVWEGLELPGIASDYHFYCKERRVSCGRVGARTQPVWPWLRSSAIWILC